MIEIHRTGYIGEKKTASYLKRRGYKILERNFRVKSGEIDIIAKKGGIIAFVEVKTRKEDAFQKGVFAVDGKKQRKIKSAAGCYLQQTGYSLQPRFDISDITVKKFGIMKKYIIEYYENAF